MEIVVTLCQAQKVVDTKYTNNMPSQHDHHCRRASHPRHTRQDRHTRHAIHHMHKMNARDEKFVGKLQKIHDNHCTLVFVYLIRLMQSPTWFWH